MSPTVTYNGTKYEVPELDLAPSYVIAYCPPIYVGRNGRTGAYDLVGTRLIDVLLEAKNRIKDTGGCILLKGGVYTIEDTFPDEDVSGKIQLQGEGIGTVIFNPPGKDAIDPTKVRLFGLVWYDRDGIPHEEVGGGVTKLSQLEIDVDKDWGEHAITRLGSLSLYKGGSYVGSLWGDPNTLTISSGVPVIAGSTAVRLNSGEGSVEIHGIGGLDMLSKRIKNLAPPADPNDAVSYSTAQDLAQSAVQSHRTLSPIDHPDGSITVSKLDIENAPVHGYVLSYNAETNRMRWVEKTSFLDLTDTPNSYVGQGGKLVAVKATEDGLEFVTGVGGTTNLWSDTAVGDWPRAEHCVPYDTSTLPLDALALRWRDGKYGTGVIFHHPSDDLPRGAVGVVEYTPSYLRYVALGVVSPAATNPQMPAAYIIAHYYGGTYNNSTSHQWLGGGGTGPGKQLLMLDYDASADKATLHFGNSTVSGGYYFFPQADNTGHIGDDTHRWARVRAVQVVIDTLTQGNFSTAPTTYLGGNVEVLETVSTSTAPYTGTLIRKGSDLAMELLTPDSATIATNKNSLSLIPGIDFSTGEHAVRTDIIRNTEHPEHSGVFMVDRGVYQSEAEIAHLCPDFHRFGTWDSSVSSYRYVRVDSNIIFPEDDNVWHLGDDSHRWARVRAVTVVAGDLKLKNEKTEWTLTEGEDGIYAINNITGKKYRIKMEEVEETE